MTLIEKLHDICKPENEAPVIQKIIENSNPVLFELLSNDSGCIILCHVRYKGKDRVFKFQTWEYEIQTHYLIFHELDPFNQEDWDRAEIPAISLDTDFLRHEFFKHIKLVEEI